MTTLTVSELIEERKARELSEKQLDDQLKLRHKEELTEFKKRLDQFQLADWHVDAIFNQIKCVWSWRNRANVHVLPEQLLYR